MELCQNFIFDWWFKKSYFLFIYFKIYSNLSHVIRMHNQNLPYWQGNEGTAIKSLWNTNAEARFAK